MRASMLQEQLQPTGEFGQHYCIVTCTRISKVLQYNSYLISTTGTNRHFEDVTQLAG